MFLHKLYCFELDNTRYDDIPLETNSKITIFPSESDPILKIEKHSPNKQHHDSQQIELCINIRVPGVN